MPRPNRGPQLSDKPNAGGFYEIRWTENGRSKRSSTGASNRGEAQQVFAAFLLALDGKPLPVTPAPEPGKVVALEVVAEARTVREVCEYYLRHRVTEARVRSKHVRICIAGSLGHIIALHGDVAMRDYGQQHVTEYQTERGAGRVGWIDADGMTRGYRKAGNPACRNDLSYLIAAATFASRSSLIAASEKPDIELPKASLPRERWLSKQEAAQLLAASAPKDGERMSRVHRCVALGLSTAARMAAMQELTWDRVDFDTRKIDYRLPGVDHGKKRRVVVRISTDLLPILERAYAERSGPYVMDHPGDLGEAFEHLLKRAKVDLGKGVKVHVLRHTWATWRAQEGASMTAIAAVLGDTVATTEKHYAHHCPDHFSDLVDGGRLPGMAAPKRNAA